MARSTSGSNAFPVNEEAFNELTAAQKREVRDLLAAASQGFEQNPLAAYVPHKKQHLFHSATQRTRGFYGGNRTGKTTAGVADDLIQFLAPEFVPPHLQPYKKFGWDEPCRIRVITPDLGHTMDDILEKFREITPRAALKGSSWEASFDKTKRILRSERGDLIDFMSFEQDPDKFGGVSRHRIHYDEEPNGPNSYKIWRDSRMRLIDTGGDEVFTMTPLFGLSWVTEKLWDRQHDPGIFVIEASMYDNPHLSKEEIELALADLTKEERESIEYGRPAHFEGKFYDEFNIGLVTDPPSRDHVKGQSIVVGIDPGLRRTAVVWIAFDNDNSALAFAELYPADMIVPDVAKLIHAKNTEWGVDPDYYVIDPSARNRSMDTGENIESAYMREGISAIHGQNERSAGIMEVKRRLQQKGLMVSSECRNLIWEFPRYRKDENSADEFAAVKEHDHLLDALRYVCMSRPWISTPMAIDVDEPWVPGTAPSAAWLHSRPNRSSPPLGAMT